MKHLTLMALVLVACSAHKAAPKAEFPEAETDNSEESSSGNNNKDTSTPEQCLDSSGSKIECLSDKDCCKGFYCGIDPEGSTRIKTCIFGGES